MPEAAPPTPDFTLPTLEAAPPISEPTLSTPEPTLPTLEPTPRERHLENRRLHVKCVAVADLARLRGRRAEQGGGHFMCGNNVHTTTPTDLTIELQAS
eukprot:70134-Chlamydomonas_euryale.AAC.1